MNSRSVGRLRLQTCLACSRLLPRHNHRGLCGPCQSLCGGQAHGFLLLAGAVVVTTTPCLPLEEATMTQNLRRHLSAWAAALLLTALTLGLFVPAASAHNATKRVSYRECTTTTQMVKVYTHKAPGKAGATNNSYTYKPMQRTTCVTKYKPISRPHIHKTERVCTYMTLAGGAVGAAAGAPGVGTAAAGGAVGGAIGYESCRLLPSIVWLG